MAFFEETDDSNRLSLPAGLLRDPKLLQLALQAQRVEAKNDAPSKPGGGAAVSVRQGGAGTSMAPKSPRADLGGSARHFFGASPRAKKNVKTAAQIQEEEALATARDNFLNQKQSRNSMAVTSFDLEQGFVTKQNISSMEQQIKKMQVFYLKYIVYQCSLCYSFTISMCLDIVCLCPGAAAGTRSHQGEGSPAGHDSRRTPPTRNRQKR